MIFPQKCGHWHFQNAVGRENSVKARSVDSILCLHRPRFRMTVSARLFRCLQKEKMRFERAGHQPLLSLSSTTFVNYTEKWASTEVMWHQRKIHVDFRWCARWTCKMASNGRDFPTKVWPMAFSKCRRARKNRKSAPGGTQKCCPLGARQISHVNKTLPAFTEREKCTLKWLYANYFCYYCQS